METTKIDFNQIYKDNYKLVYGWVIAKVKNVERTEEITNDVFIKVHQHLAVYDCERAKLSTWLYEITKNKIVDYFRSEGMYCSRFVSVDNFVKDDDEQVETSNFFIGYDKTEKAIENKELKAKLKQVFSCLNANQKSVARLFFIQKLQYNEIADVLNISMDNVKVTINRARMLMQSQLANEYANIKS